MGCISSLQRSKHVRSGSESDSDTGRRQTTIPERKSETISESGDTGDLESLFTVTGDSLKEHRYKWFHRHITADVYQGVFER